MLFNNWFLGNNIEDNNLRIDSKKSNFNNINDKSDIKTLISFNQQGWIIWWGKERWLAIW